MFTALDFALELSGLGFSKSLIHFHESLLFHDEMKTKQQIQRQTENTDWQE